MDLQTTVLFLLFVCVNTIFSYRAGLKDGTFNGMHMAFRFLKNKSALKDKNSVIGFMQWPVPLQELFNDPDNLEIDD